MTEPTTRPARQVIWTNIDPDRSSWVAQHPGAALTLLGMVLVALQWAGTHWLHNLQAPDRKKSEAEIRGIRRDIRTITTYQLETQRFNRDILTDLARKEGLSFERPPELVDAEDKARKLRNR